MCTDQKLDFARQDGGFTTDYLVNVAVFQQAIVLGVALTRDFVIESDTYSLFDMKEYNDIKYVELFENESKVDLHPIGLETKKYYKEVK